MLAARELDETAESEGGAGTKSRLKSDKSCEEKQAGESTEDREERMLCGGEGGGADRAVHVQVALGALHLDKVIGRKLQADAAQRPRAGRVVFLVPALKSAFEIGAF